MIRDTKLRVQRSFGLSQRSLVTNPTPLSSATYEPKSERWRAILVRSASVREQAADPDCQLQSICYLDLFARDFVTNNAAASPIATPGRKRERLGSFGEGGGAGVSGSLIDRSRLG